jgi:hypothetical protein
VGRRIEWTSIETPLDPGQIGRVILIGRSAPEAD